MKPLFFSLKIRLLFTDLFRIQLRNRIRIQIRIRNVYFGSGSNPEPAKSFGSFRIQIRNTVFKSRRWNFSFLVINLTKDPSFLLHDIHSRRKPYPCLVLKILEKNPQNKKLESIYG